MIFALMMYAEISAFNVNSCLVGLLWLLQTPGKNVSASCSVIYNNSNNNNKRATLKRSVEYLWWSFFAKKVTIDLQKASMVDVRQGSKYASVHIYKCSSIQTRAFDQTKTMFAANSHGISKECV